MVKLVSFSSSGNFIAQSSDPGFLGAGAIWSKTDSGVTFRRNDADTAWKTLLPPGCVIPWSGDEADVYDGMLICDGQAVSRTTYAELFDLIGTRFGVGNGSTTFNVPDLQTNNSFVRGASADGNIGDTGGASTVTLTAAESGLPEHTHGVTDAGHNHDFPRNLDNGSPTQTGYSTGNTGVGGTLDSVTSETTGITIDNVSAAGASSAHENKPPYLDCHWVITT